MTSVLNHISELLTGMCASDDVPMAGCWYGACQETKLDRWNYFVFKRVRTATSSNNIDRETFYQVHVIHEDYIPEGYIDTVIKTLEKTPGPKLKKTSDDITYDYTFKGNSNMVVEIATITFVHPQKRSC